MQADALHLPDGVRNSAGWAVLARVRRGGFGEERRRKSAERWREQLEARGSISVRVSDRMKKTEQRWEAQARRTPQTCMALTQSVRSPNFIDAKSGRPSGRATSLSAASASQQLHIVSPQSTAAFTPASR